MKLPSALDAWFQSRFPAGFSRIQKEALPHTLKGENTLILAPTGSGKTLAAFLSILARLARLPRLPNATCAVYVSPLRSLSRDIERNLTGPLEALNAGRADPIRMEIRTGDTDASERALMQRKRPHLLLTTPESLSALLSQTGWRDGFAPFAVVVDEVHAFAENKRGSLLALTLERLALHSAQPDHLQRIGLSATAHPVAAVQRLLCGIRSCQVASVPIAKTHKLEIAQIPEGTSLPAAGYSPYRVAHIVADLVMTAHCTLAFTATRSAAERLGLALKLLLPEHEDHIDVHHASVDRVTRLRIEDGLATGAMKAVVCSTSLELGVDFQAVDQVILVGCPRGVSRAMQRLGRAGHRVDGVATGALVPLSLPDLLQCIALREAARCGRLDALSPPQGPLDVLAQVVLGMAVERPWKLDDAFALIRRAGPYLDLDRTDFDAVIDYLAGGGKVLGPYGSYGKILVSGGMFQCASRKVAQSYYMNIGTISDEFHVKVIGRGNRHLGEVEEGFIAGLQPDEGFIIGGKSVRVRTLHQNMAMVEPAQGERVKTPRWMGGKMSLTARLAQEEVRLRRGLREHTHDAVAYLRKEWRVDASTARRAAEFVARQSNASALPIDSPVHLEKVRQGRAQLYIFHVIAGRAVNRSLAWVTGHRLANTFGERGGSVVANFDDHAFLLSIDARHALDAAALRHAFHPAGFPTDLREALEKTETLGRKFRPIAETAQLLARRTTKGPAQKRSASWSGSLLYQTFQQHEPDHPLLREAVREVLKDELDADAACAEAGRIHSTPWEIFELESPSPFSLPLFSEFNREVLLAQDPDRALDDLVESLYDRWK